MHLGRWDTIKYMTIRSLQSLWQVPQAHGSRCGHSSGGEDSTPRTTQAVQGAATPDPPPLLGPHHPGKG